MKIKYVLFLMGLVFSCNTFAIYSAKIFSSNNTDIIDVKRAYDRLVSDFQDDLKNDAIDIFQQYHVEQNKCEDVLGMYSSDYFITADNTKLFTTSPYQNLSQELILDFARQLAIKLRQESVAVFIPSQNASPGNYIVTFNTLKYTLDEAVNLINIVLPKFYQQAYTIHMSQKNSGYKNVKVISMEWLGSQAKLEDLQKAFPKENISVQRGKAFLIYQDGRRQEL